MNLFEIQGGFESMVASTRVRLARNIKGYRYGAQPPEVRKEIAEKVFQVLDSAPALHGEFTMQQVQADSQDAQGLVEQHMISPALAQQGGWAIVCKNGAVSIMIGEEDHLRIQVMGTGLCTRECLQEAKRIASLLEASIPMDYDEKLGYLTACPTNLGTGLRVSVMLHLPILTATHGMQRVIGWAGQQGCAVRGAFGEGTRAEGDYYQLSNQVTLGLSEDALADKLTEAATRVIEAEKQARQAVRQQDEDGLADRICRAVGLLKTARRMDTTEAQTYLSDVLMGLQLGLLGGITPQEVYQVTREIYPVSLSDHQQLSAQQRDKARATRLRERVGAKLKIL